MAATSVEDFQLPFKRNSISLNLEMKAVAYLLLAPALLAVMSIESHAQAGRKSSLIREPGAMYVEDVVSRPINLPALRDAPIYYNLDMKRFLGTIRGGTSMQLIAMSGELYKVRGQATHSFVVGWMRAADLTALDPKFIENVKKLVEREWIVAELIENKQVALGMKLDEVRESIGRPNEKSSKLDKGGRKDVYEYIDHSIIPQLQTVRGLDGRLYNTYVNTRVISSHLIVTFENEIVVSVEEKEARAPVRPAIRIPPPVVFF